MTTWSASETPLTLADLERGDPRSRPRGVQQRFLCPFPACQGHRKVPEHRSLTLNTLTGAYHCHRCGSSGVLGERQKVQDPGLRPPPPPPDETWREHLRGLVPIVGTPGADYLRSRGVSLVQARRARVRFHPDWFGRPAVVFAVHTPTGHLVAAQGRYLDDRAPKVRSTGEVVRGAFATERAWDADVLVVTEGPFDALSLASVGIHALALCGTAWRTWFPGILRRRRVVVAFDADEAGDRAAEEWVQSLGPWGLRWRPEGGKDWNELLVRGGGPLIWECMPDPLAEAT